jgi:hypothetical protein
MKDERGSTRAVLLNRRTGYLLGDLEQQPGGPAPIWKSLHSASVVWWRRQCEFGIRHDASVPHRAGAKALTRWLLAGW